MYLDSCSDLHYLSQLCLCHGLAQGYQHADGPILEAGPSILRLLPVL